MRAFIQRPTDGLYFKTKLEWVRERAEARAFSSSVDALAYCIAAGLSEVRLVISSGTGPDSFLYPFGEERNVRLTASKGAAKLLKRAVRAGTRVSKQVPFTVPQKAETRAKVVQKPAKSA